MELLMKFDQNQLNSLREAGLNSYESRCYLSLLVYKKLNARECSKISGIPPTKTHETLRMLEDKGLITSTDDKPKLFQVTPIEKGLENYLLRKENIIANLRNELKNSLKNIKTIEEHEPVREKILVTSGKERQYELSLNITKNCVRELLIISRGELLPIKLLVESKRAMKRGVRIKYIITKIEDNEKLIQDLKKLGYDVRFFDMGEIFMAIRDRIESLLIVKNPANVEDRICISITDKNLSKFHANYFNLIWKKTKKI